MNKALSITVFTSFVTLGAMSLAQADSGANPIIPDKVKEHVLKRHPQASDIQAHEESHFGNKLLKVTYKDGEELNMDLFRTNGSLFTNVLPMDDPTPLPSALLKTLKNEFADFQFKKAELVVNPNSIGEEYTVYGTVNNENRWLLINDKGQLLGKGQF